MESNVLTVVLLPLALFIIMLGMGLGLTLDDFKRILTEPKGGYFGVGGSTDSAADSGFLSWRKFFLSPQSLLSG